MRSCFASVTKTQGSTFPERCRIPSPSPLPLPAPCGTEGPQQCPWGDGEQEDRTHHGNGGVELGDAHPARRMLAVEALIGEAAAVTGLHCWLCGVRIQVNELLTWAEARTYQRGEPCQKLSGERTTAEPAHIHTEESTFQGHLASHHFPKSFSASTTTVATPL